MQKVISITVVVLAVSLLFINNKGEVTEKSKSVTEHRIDQDIVIKETTLPNGSKEKLTTIKTVTDFKVITIKETEKRQKLNRIVGLTKSLDTNLFKLTAGVRVVGDVFITGSIDSSGRKEVGILIEF